MAFSQEDLHKFTSKVQELMKNQSYNFIKEEDLFQIAEAIGIKVEDLAQIKKDSLKRGLKHLEFDNLKEAKQELEQVLLLSPNEAEALYGLAKVHYEFWQKNAKKADREKAYEYAQKCVQEDPNFSQAYSIIQKTKAPKFRFWSRKLKPTLSNKTAIKPSLSKKTKPKTSSKNAWKGVAFGFLISSFVLLVSFPETLEWVGVYNFKNAQGFVAYQGADGPIVALSKYYYNPTIETSTYRIYLLDPSSRELKKIIDLEEFPKSLTRIGENLYYLYPKNGDFEGRNIYTGKLIDNKEILGQFFPELSSGIGKVESYYYEWLKLSLKKDGSIYYYHPGSKTLLTEKELNKKEQKPAYTWYKKENPLGSASQFLMFKEPKTLSVLEAKLLSPKPRNPAPIYRPRAGQELSQIPSPEFLEASLLYADSSFCLVSHQSEIGSDAKKRLTAMSAQGEVLWEFKEEAEECPLLFKKYFWGEASRMKILRQGPSLLFSASNVEMGEDSDISIALSLLIKDGSIEWQYSPSRSF